MDKNILFRAGCSHFYTIWAVGYVGYVISSSNFGYLKGYDDGGTQLFGVQNDIDFTLKYFS